MGYAEVFELLPDSNTYKTYSLAYGEAITPEPAPDREGYTFSGWSEIPETMPAHDVTVTGSFAVNSYTLTYLLDGEVYKTYSLAYGETITPEPAPEKEGYTFSGWGEIPATMPAHDVTITGSFAVNYYTLTWMVGSEVFQTDLLAYGETIVAPEVPERDGYEFSGWQDVPETMPAHDLTIYSNFTTGIEVLMTDGVSVDIYTLAGVKLYGRVRLGDVYPMLPQGFYVINRHTYYKK